ncbi:MAG: decarboxylase [Pseudonocardiales bacterium]|nr:decarboxylase [Pseudonocardiales bacterium]
MDEQSPPLVAELDLLPPDAATRALHPVCASTAWLDDVVTDRPYGSLDALVAASQAALRALTWADILEAISVHARIGAKTPGDDQESQWSRGEQSAAADAAEATQHALLAGNAEYEARFGYVFMICATGLSAEQMLGSLTERLGNDPVVEQGIVRAELGKIVDLRLRKAYR